MSAIAEHYRGGSGEPLLLIHGYTATWEIFGDLPERLSAEFDVFAPTLPGHHGGPPTPEPATVVAIADGLEAMLDELGWETAHIAGFSLGGWLSFELAKRGRARSVTALSPAGFKASRRDARRTARLFLNDHRGARVVARGTAEKLAGRPGFRRYALKSQMVHGERVPPQECVRMIRSFAATPGFRALGEHLKTAILEDVDRVDVPVHIAWAERDRVLRKHNVEYFRERLPEARYSIIEGAGHVPFWDAPDTVHDAIISTAISARRQESLV